MRNSRSAILVLIVTILLFAEMGTLGIANAASHDFTGLPLDVNGWTDIGSLVQSNSRIIYVSTSGNDGTGAYYTDESHADIGGNAFAPTGSVMAYQTLSAAYAQVRDGYPDILLLKRGDAWSESLTWRKDGESQTTPAIIAAYGSTATARPVMDNLNLTGTGYTTNYVVISDISIDNLQIAATGGAKYVTVEGCLFPTNTNTGIILQDDSGGDSLIMDYIAFRRNVIYERNYTTGDLNSGLYCDDFDHLLLEENVFDKNGWPDEEGDQSDAADLRCHNVYIMLTHSTSHPIIRYNITTRSRSIGLICGSGGIIYGNLAVENPISFEIGKAEAWEWGGKGPSATMQDNVSLDTQDVNTDSPRGWGLYLQHADTVTIDENIFGYSPDGNYSFAISVNSQVSGKYAAVDNVTIQNNVIHNACYGGYQGDSVIYIDGQDASNFVFTNNKIHQEYATVNRRMISSPVQADITSSSGNQFYTTQVTSSWFSIGGSATSLDTYKAIYNDSTSASAQTNASGDYGITDYLAYIDETATMDAFYNKIRTLRKGNWDHRYSSVPIINFIRDKFGIDPIQALYENPDGYIAAPANFQVVPQ